MLALLTLPDGPGALAAPPPQGESEAETVAELRAALAELRRRLAEVARPPTEAELQVARRQIERLTETMVGLRRERDSLRGELVALRDERDRLRAADTEQRQRLAASEAEVERLRRDAEQVSAPLPVALAVAEPASRHEVLAGAAFASGRAELRDQATARLLEIALWLRSEPAAPILIEGHTDASGDDEANRRLSVARAEAVRDRLAALGISLARIEVVGRGELEPVADNDTPEGRAANRRVVVTLDP